MSQERAWGENSAHALPQDSGSAACPGGLLPLFLELRAARAA
jgi:hypothetical protein